MFIKLLNVMATLQSGVHSTLNLQKGCGSQAVHFGSWNCGFCHLRAGQCFQTPLRRTIIFQREAQQSSLIFFKLFLVLFLVTVLLFLTVILTTTIIFVTWWTVSSTVCFSSHISKSTTQVDRQSQASNGPAVRTSSMFCFHELDTRVGDELNTRHTNRRAEFRSPRSRAELGVTMCLNSI